MTSFLTPSGRNKLNLCLLGAPGSGKGSYGKLLSNALQIPLISVSDVLRQYMDNEHHLMASTGTLLPDETVSRILQNYILHELNRPWTETSRGYILDGFPRTLGQIQIMMQDTTWPRSIQMEGAIALQVPNAVCQQKIMGRRYCTKCDSHFNTSHVVFGDFDLPAQLPTHPDCYSHGVLEEEDGSSRIHLHCEKEHWVTRPDDACPDIVQHRLDIHDKHTTPMLDYLEHRGLLLKFAPYKGYDDVPRFHRTVEEWIGTQRVSGDVTEEALT